MSKLDAARAWLEQNKKTVAVVGAVGVGGLALAKRGGGGADVTTTGEEAAAGAGAAYGLSYAGGAAYDSTGSDVYNALQPQLESLGQKQSALEELLNKLNEKPAPTPVAKPPATAPKPAPAPPKAAPKPAAAPRVYTVKPGDNLTKIARGLGLPSWQQLYAGNKGVIGGNPNLIRPGQQLRY